MEVEKYFLLNCELYDIIRQNLYRKNSNLTLQTEFTSLSSNNKLAYLLNEHPRKTAKYIVKAYLCRKTVMYSSFMTELYIDR